MKKPASLDARPSIKAAADSIDHRAGIADGARADSDRFQFGAESKRSAEAVASDDAAPDAGGKHVVFIGVDGTQYSQVMANASGLLGGMDHLEGYTGGIKGTPTKQATYSGPGWSTLLSGVWTDEHGITSNSNSPINEEVDSLFERIDPLGEMASLVSWPDINVGHFALETGHLDQPSIIDYQASTLSDRKVAQNGAALIGDEAPVFSFLYLGDPDNVGHASGFGSAYTTALQLAEQQVKQIWASVVEREAANPDEDWMVIISTDHGRVGAGFSHGGQSAAERQIFIGSNLQISSSGAAPQTSVAATILDFLGLSQAGVRGPSVLDDGAVDTTAPVLLATHLTGASNTVAIGGPLHLVLSEDVRAGEGAIVIHRADDDSVVETIDVQSSQVEILGGVVTITPGDLLDADTGFYATVDAGAFLDMETQAPTRLYWEDFESLSDDLGRYRSGTEVKDKDKSDWTADAPDGWTAIDNSAPGGVTEFAGWTFHDKESWIKTAGDQGRAFFSGGQGVVAVADGDEYYDAGGLSGSKFRTFLQSPAVDLTGVEAGTATLSFASSWVPDPGQTARITVSYDGGAAVEVLKWSSKASDANYHATSGDEMVTVELDNPSGAETAVLAFEVKAGNDWWWAIDNIAIDGLIPGEGGGNGFAGIQGEHEWTFRTVGDALVEAPGAAENFYV